MNRAPAADEVTQMLAAYGVIAQRRSTYDVMAWQTPALSFAAQAFLFSIALGPDTSRFARVIASCLALIIAGVSIQLMKKHLHLELIDSIILRRLEGRLATYKVIDLENPPHTPADLRRAGLRNEAGEIVAPDRLERVHSPAVWLIALALFGATAAGVALVTAFWPDLL